VAGQPLLAHKAMFEGHGVAEMLSGKQHIELDKDQIPGALTATRNSRPSA